MRERPAAGVLFAPHLPATVIDRTDLVGRLETARTPLLIVRGPAGSGKTTLVADWARSHPQNGIWVALDPSAGHRLAFWQRVVDAVIASGMATPGPGLHGIVTSSESAAGLRAALLKGFTQGAAVTLVLDDFHEVVDTEVQEDLHWLLRSGAQLRIVLVTRTATSLESPEHLARVDTTVVLPSELVLSLSEVREVAVAVGAEPSVAAKLHTALSGLALPTRVALLDLASGRASSIDDAITNLVAAKGGFPLNLDPASDYALFLLRSSIAARLTPDLAEQFGSIQATSYLAELERDGLGSWGFRADQPEFTIHPYLRQRLETQLFSRLPTEVPGLRAAYANDRIDRDDPMEAARQFVHIDDLSGVVRVVRRFYGELVRIYPDDFADLLRTIDPSKLRRHPELIAMLLLDAARTPGAPKVGILQLATLAIAGAQARFGRNEPVDRVSLLMTLLAGQRLSGNYEAAHHTAARLADAVGTLDTAGRDSLRGLLPQAVIHIGTTHYYADDLAAARSAYQEAWQLARATERPWAEVHADSMLALTDATSGDIGAARARVETARPRSRPQGWQGTYTAAGYHLAAAHLALEEFDAARARALLDELSEHEPTIEHWPVIAHLRATAALIEGRPYPGLDRLERDIAAHSNRPPISRAMTSLLTTTRADLLLADRQPVRAADVLRAARHDPSVRLALSRVELVTGDYVRAMDRAAAEAWSNESTARAKATAMLTVAIAARHLRQDSAARDATARAVHLLASSQLRTPLLRFPQTELRALFDQTGLDPDALLDGIPDLFPALHGNWKLTPAEMRVLRALEDTTSVDSLAAELHLSSNTIKTHLRQLYRKLGANSREEALGVAALNGLVEGSASER